jgi:hypothetical protein
LLYLLESSPSSILQILQTILSIPSLEQQQQPKISYSITLYLRCRSNSVFNQKSSSLYTSYAGVS